MIAFCEHLLGILIGIIAAPLFLVGLILGARGSSRYFRMKSL